MPGLRERRLHGRAPQHPRRSRPPGTGCHGEPGRRPGLTGPLLGISGGRGGVVAAGGGGPPHDSGLGLVELPARGLFTAVVVTAERGQIALAGPAALVVGLGVVEVAADGGALAAGRAAGGGAGPDQVLELAAGLVARLLVTVVADALGQRGDGDGEAR